MLEGFCEGTGTPPTAVEAVMNEVHMISESAAFGINDSDVFVDVPGTWLEQSLCERGYSQDFWRMPRLIPLGAEREQSEARAALLDKDLNEVCTLEAECDGEPCRVVQTKDDVVRLVAPRPGELRLRLHNKAPLHWLWYDIRRLDGDGSRGRVNDWNVVRPSSLSSWLERDASTGRAMLVEAARDSLDCVVAEADPRAAVVPRTRFLVSVCPAVDRGTESVWGDHCWTPKGWVAVAGGSARGSRDSKLLVSVVALPDTQTRRIPAKLSMTVAELKAATRALSPAPMGSAAAEHHQLYLATGSAQLPNDKTLVECGVESESMLLLFPVPDAAHRAGKLLVHVAVGDACSEAEDEVITLPLQHASSINCLRGKLSRRLNLRLPCVSRQFTPSDDCCLFYLRFLPRGDPVRAIDEEGLMQIFVEDVACHVGQNWTIGDLKEELAIKHDMHLDDFNFRVVFAGQRLEKNRTFAEYNIRSGDHLQVHIRKLGGSPMWQADAKGPLVARVVPGEVRAEPLKLHPDVVVLWDKLAPKLTVEVSVNTGLLSEKRLTSNGA